MAEDSASGPAAQRPARSRAWNVGLWVAQVLLFLAFALAGFFKVAFPMSELEQRMTWVRDLPALLVRFIGTCELAGSLGMLLPALTRILPRLTALAGSGLATIMLLAIAFHVSRG